MENEIIKCEIISKCVLQRGSLYYTKNENLIRDLQKNLTIKLLYVPHTVRKQKELYNCTAT